MSERETSEWVGERGEEVSLWTLVVKSSIEGLKKVVGFTRFVAFAGFAEERDKSD